MKRLLVLVTLSCSCDPGIESGSSQVTTSTSCSIECTPVVAWMDGAPARHGQWTDDPRSVRLVSGAVTVTYEDLGFGQNGSHSLYLGPDRVTGYKYGDYSYWTSTIASQATSAWVIESSQDRAEVAFLFEHAGIHLVKRVAVMRCYDGMFVGWDSYPTTTAGEREIGIGSAAPVTFASSGVVAYHPAAGGHVNYGLAGQQAGPWWIAALPSATPGIVAYLVLAQPYLSLSYQFDPAQEGYATVNQISEGTEKYQAYYGAFRDQDVDPAALADIVNLRAGEASGHL